MSKGEKTGLALAAFVATFLFLAVAFGFNLWGRPEVLPVIPPVKQEVLATEPWRLSYADLVAADEDVTEFDCYLCHEEDVVLELDFDEDGKLLIAEEHEDIEIAHGRHPRTNNCYNCHDAKNLTLFQTQDGRELTFEESDTLCGSCHSPVHEDWEAGSHGRSIGFWDRSAGETAELGCVNCHDPHSPRFPAHEPAPGPNYLRGNSHHKEY